jgi:hypothetical protein
MEENAHRFSKFVIHQICHLDYENTRVRWVGYVASMGEIIVYMFSQKFEIRRRKW